MFGMLSSKQTIAKTINIIIITFILASHAYAHQKLLNSLDSKQITGTINHLIPIQLNQSIEYIHSASTVIPEDSNYIVVHPSKVQPVQMYIQPYQLPTNFQSILQQLRTFQTSHYNDMIIFQDKIFLHLLPNKIVILSQKNIGTPFGSFGFGMGMGMNYEISIDMQIQNTYTIDQITGRNETKMYKVKNGKQYQVLLTTNTRAIYILSLKQYHMFQLEQPLELGHLQFVDDNVFLTAEEGKGIRQYNIQKNGISRKRRYSCEQLGIIKKGLEDIKQGQQAEFNINQQVNQIAKSECFISDISFNLTSRKVYFIDTYSGLYSGEIRKFQEKDYTIQNTVLISQTIGCDALDLVSQNHIVLICQMGMPNSYLLQVIKLPDPMIKGKQIYVKKDPIYHQCNFNDLIVFRDFFLAFDEFNIQVFWNQLTVGSDGQYKNQHTKQHFNIPGIEIFGVKRVPASNTTQEQQIYLYVVQQNRLLKYKLGIWKGYIYIHSSTPVKKQIKIHIPGKCDQKQVALLTNNRQFNKNTQCVYELKVNLDIQEFVQVVSRQKVSMSIGVIILMLAVIVILTWICLVKYRGLEKHAKRILEKYRNKSRYNQNKFSL